MSTAELVTTSASASNSVPTSAELGRTYEELLGSMQPEVSHQLRSAAAVVNLEELGKATERILGVACNGCFWIATGGSRFVYVLTTVNGQEVVARVSRRDMYLGSPPLSESELRDLILSEVATLKYLYAHTSIPVPKVLGYDVRLDSAVGAPFILQERIKGKPPLISRMIQSDQAKFAGQLSRCFSVLLQQSFSHLGSLYPAGEGENDVRIGPWGQGPLALRYRPRGRCGPFDSVASWFQFQATCMLQFLDSAPYEAQWLLRHPEATAVDRRVSWVRAWYAKVLQNIDQLRYLRERASVPFVLTHDDFNAGNILVSYAEPSRILAILDWEGARCAPLWATLPFPQDHDYGWGVGEDRKTFDHLVRSALVDVCPEVGQATERDACLRKLSYVLRATSCVFDYESFERAVEDMLKYWQYPHDLFLLSLERHPFPLVVVK